MSKHQELLILSKITIQNCQLNRNSNSLQPFYITIITILVGSLMSLVDRFIYCYYLLYILLLEIFLIEFFNFLLSFWYFRNKFENGINDRWNSEREIVLVWTGMGNNYRGSKVDTLKYLKRDGCVVSLRIWVWKEWAQICRLTEVFKFFADSIYKDTVG